MSTQCLTRADTTLAGAAYHPGYSSNAGGRHGVEMSHIFAHDYGAIPAALTGGIINSATSAELPNAGSIVYTPATDGTGPLDAATRHAVVTEKFAGVEIPVWNLGEGRNLITAVTHATSVVAMTVLYEGFDVYREPCSELHTITATGTTKTVTGKKAMRWLKQVTITSAGNATTNTLIASSGTAIGLRAVARHANHVVIAKADGDDETDGAVIVPADLTDPATSATGDVRGTITFTTPPDGTKQFLVGILVVDRSSKESAFGVTQA